jgi:hypothetical protein
MLKNNNVKKLLCYNIVNNIKCVYKNKCMFAHNLEEQFKEPIREFIINMIYSMNDLSNINIKENKELFDELMIFTKECKNCIISKRCPGGYNCKFGVCIKELKICYNDLLNGKCNLLLEEEIVNDKKIKRCINGIHLTEKNLIPYHQRMTYEMNVLDFGVFLFNNINYYSKINTISIMLNDDTIKIAKKLITKNKINKNDILTKVNYWDKYNVNYFNSDKNLNINETEDNLFEDENIIREYQIEKQNDNNINDFFWRYHQYNLNSETTDRPIIDENIINDGKLIIHQNDENIDVKIKNMIEQMTENIDN